MGGWFHSPVVSNGHVYIAANDGSVYAYNLTSDSGYGSYKKQDPFDQESNRSPLGL
jgi:uncharacterized protein involved in high-affinity Fe2+ transport